jgi:CO/xanthine dehydrogenase Mo-binding subunit
MTQSAFPKSHEVNPSLAQWLRFDGAGAVTVFSGKVELGQGIRTAIAQIAAEELDVPLECVRVLAGDTSCTPNEWWTSASVSIEIGGSAVRLACAEARALFVEAAAARLEVPSCSVELRAGVFGAPGKPARLSYWDLAPGVRLDRKITGQAPLKDPERYAIVGQSVPRPDLVSKLTGAAFVHDMELPGMLHGRVLRPPSYHSRLASIDRSRLDSLPGVACLVVDGSFVGVCAEREEQAVHALEAARRASTWRPGELLAAHRDVAEFLRGLSRLPPETVSHKDAPVQPGRDSLSARYTKPYIAHASIGPSCAVARFAEGRLTVWSHTQGNYLLRTQLAKVLAMSEMAITVVHRDGAGCYGHNGADDVALDAALLARAAARPVKVVWSREDELAWAPFGPAMAIDVSARFTRDGHVTHWNYELYSCTHLTRPGWGDGVGLLAAWHLATPHPVPAAKSPPLSLGGGGERNAVPLYDFPNQDVRHHFVTAMPLRVSALRSLGAYGNVFAIESFMDELAAAVRVDPVVLRERHLSDPRATAVIREAIRIAGEAPRAGGAAAAGRGLGFARYKNTGAYCAVITDIEVDTAVRVRRAFAAVDAGLVINPDGARNQIEGGIVQAISWTLLEAVRWDESGIRSRSWEDYPILPLGEAPDITVSILRRVDQPALGVGECMTGPTAAAVGNGLYAAMGVRVRELPLSPERIIAAMEEAAT